MAKKTKNLNIRIEPALINDLNEYAARVDASAAEVVRVAIIEYIAQGYERLAAHEHTPPTLGSPSAIGG